MDHERTHLLDVVDAYEDPLAPLVQDGQLLGELALVDGGRRHGASAMHGGDRLSSSSSAGTL